MYRICDRLSNRKKKMFFGPIIENIMSKLKNSKWRIQNGGYISANSQFFAIAMKLSVWGFLRSLITNLMSELQNSRRQRYISEHARLYSSFSCSDL